MAAPFGLSAIIVLILLAVATIGIVMTIFKSAGQIRVGHVNLQCPHCNEETAANLQTCQHCHQEL